MPVRAIIPHPERGFTVITFEFFCPVWDKNKESILDCATAWFERLDEAQRVYPEAEYYEKGYRLVGDSLFINE